MILLVELGKVIRPRLSNGPLKHVKIVLLNLIFFVYKLQKESILGFMHSSTTAVGTANLGWIPSL